MPISVARKAEFYQRNDQQFRDLDIKLQPLVLTAGQVVDYNLPRVPVKASDKRKAGWEASHGQGQVELDALEALYPGTLSQIVKEAILQYYDPDLYHKSTGQRRDLLHALADERQEVIARHQGEIDELERGYSTRY
jgi:hypothetical protein